MSAFNGIYIRANSTATLDAVRGGLDPFEVEQHGDFIGVKLPPRQAPEETLRRLSTLFETDVFWLGYESAMDCFEFHHWHSGKALRAIAYGMEEERIWERADGEPEPWEQKFFFHPKNLECDLECAESDEQKEALQRVYRERKIEVGLMGPGISSKETADAIAHHYGFPHYGL